MIALFAVFLAATPVRVCAAASLRDVLPAFLPDATYTFDASSKIAKQTRAGAPCDVVIVADSEWATWLEAEAKKARTFKIGTRHLIASNRLVAIVNQSVSLAPADLRALVDGAKKLALGGEAVPAGRYAEQALKAAGVWEDAKPRVVRADHVRIALDWVRKNEVDAAIVYVTDTRGVSEVRVAFEVDPKLHAHIEYLAYARTPAAETYVERLTGQGGRDALLHAGFNFAP